MKYRKKLVLTLVFLCGVLYSNAQNVMITDLAATSTDGGISVNVKTISFNGAGYLSNSYSVTGNVIDLSVCYWFNMTLPVLEFDNDFFIPLTEAGEYTVNITIKASSSMDICDNYATTDNGTTNATFLTTDNFEVSDFALSPNPTSGRIQFKGTDLNIHQIDVFDNLGRLVKGFEQVTENSLDLSELSEGIYLMKIQTEKGNLNQKIILKR